MVSLESLCLPLQQLLRLQHAADLGRKPTRGLPPAMLLALKTYLGMEFPHDPAIPLLDTRRRELKTYVHTDTRTCTFIAALFTMAKK